MLLLLALGHHWE